MRNNTKLLTLRQLNDFNKMYEFTLDEDDNVCVQRVGYNRITKHRNDESFIINSPIRKVTFTTDSIEYWIKYRKSHLIECSLIDVQHAVNKLYLMYQDINAESVLDVLRNPTKFNLKEKENEE